MRLSSVLYSLLDMVYPRICAGCGGNVDLPSGHICWECLSALEVVSRPYCRICGDPVEGMVDGEYDCSICRNKRPRFEQARSVFRFRGPMKNIIHALKYQQGAYLMYELALHMSECVKSHFAGVPFDAVVCVPLFSKRQRERGYNQATLLASGLADALKLDFAPTALLRLRDTKTQTDLNAGSRATNVKGAFGVRLPSWVDGRRLLLVDDVMTTGATIRECAKVLKDTSAASVHVVTLGRG
jgi:ComF family protein